MVWWEPETSNSGFFLSSENSALHNIHRRNWLSSSFQVSFIHSIFFFPMISVISILLCQEIQMTMRQLLWWKLFSCHTGYGSSLMYSLNLLSLARSRWSGYAFGQGPKPAVWLTIAKKRNRWAGKSMGMCSAITKIERIPGMLPRPGASGQLYVPW